MLTDFLCMLNLNVKMNSNKSFFITWKTTKKNLPGKTFHGTFYNTRKAAQDKYLTRRERRTRQRRPKKKALYTETETAQI